MPGMWTDDQEAMFVARMNRIGTMFDREVGEQLLAIYRENLDDLDGDLVVNGLMACEQESRFFPSVAEIRERSGANRVALMQERIEERMDGPRPLLNGCDQSERIVADVMAEAQRRHARVKPENA